MRTGSKIYHHLIETDKYQAPRFEDDHSGNCSGGPCVLVYCEIDALRQICHNDKSQHFCYFCYFYDFFFIFLFFFFSSLFLFSFFSFSLTAVIPCYPIVCSFSPMTFLLYHISPLSLQIPRFRASMATPINPTVLTECYSPLKALSGISIPHTVVTTHILAFGIISVSCLVRGPEPSILHCSVSSFRSLFVYQPHFFDLELSVLSWLAGLFVLLCSRLVGIHYGAYITANITLR